MLYFLSFIFMIGSATAMHASNNSQNNSQNNTIQPCFLSCCLWRTIDNPDHQSNTHLASSFDAPTHESEGLYLILLGEEDGQESVQGVHNPIIHHDEADTDPQNPRININNSNPDNS